MTLADFNNLLRRYLDGQATSTELWLIDRWYDSLNERVNDQYTPDEQSRLKARMWRQINQSITPEEPTQTTVLPLPGRRRPVGWMRRSGWLAAAVVLLVLAGVGVSWLNNWPGFGAGQGVPAFRGELADLSAGLAEHQNTTDSPITLRLPDGSTVYLTPRSSLRIASSLRTGERTVYLTGDAFFTVARDSRRPFRVITEQVETQVLGTSFWIHTAGQANKVDVEVSTGKVQVYERTRQGRGNKETPAASRGVVLTPNQMVTITNREHWQTGLIPRPVPIRADPTTPSAATPKVDRLVFDNTPVAEICQRLTTLYGITIDLANADLVACTFSGDISRQPIYTQLDLLCAAINARYDIRGTHILISGRGCAR